MVGRSLCTALRLRHRSSTDAALGALSTTRSVLAIDWRPVQVCILVRLESCSACFTTPFIYNEQQLYGWRGTDKSYLRRR
ncbi:hypothetical protein NDU88_007402 [Pleurodeles waltl]|uniref:Secreted protein n=1 Tax=Pleurodeles waltl TaxID=8319 RepID=A0AAV7NUV0_PLEWA|nr:hypothetical protein NDU88_007402 [Pleurodeles waltl]